MVISPCPICNHYHAGTVCGELKATTIAGCEEPYSKSEVKTKTTRYVTEEKYEELQQRLAIVEAERNKLKELIYTKFENLRTDGKTILDFYACWYHQDRNTISKLKAERDRLKENYYELIMEVYKKFPGETRHQTALRYEAENRK